ncbi:hypothetical protein RU10_18495 [Pseudomonas fluorescens]|uniref:Uncharacterized protein n=1 Tax=Pseudomonas fluorescens TaxID=294 RepID=A0AAE2AUG4_PSEFL|nr:hypothetical protein RU10_18495 [Pseudomonas fluorescens]
MGFERLTAAAKFLSPMYLRMFDSFIATAGLIASRLAPTLVSRTATIQCGSEPCDRYKIQVAA